MITLPGKAFENLYVHSDTCEVDHLHYLVVGAFYNLDVGVVPDFGLQGAYHCLDLQAYLII